MIELVKAIKNADTISPSYLHGNIEFLGVDFHVSLLRITYKDDEMFPYDSDNDFELFCDIQSFNEGRYHTIQIPGREGDWVMFIYPYCM